MEVVSVEKFLQAQNLACFFSCVQTFKFGEDWLFLASLVLLFLLVMVVVGVEKLQV
jgi:hypothetical protein